MLSKMKQALILLLCLLTMASTATACGTHTDDSEDTDRQTTAAEEAETVDEAREALDAIGKIDWGGGDFTWYPPPTTKSSWAPVPSATSNPRRSWICSSATACTICPSITASSA